MQYYCHKLKSVNLLIKIDKYIDPFLRNDPYIVSFTLISLLKLWINIFPIYWFFGNIVLPLLLRFLLKNDISINKFRIVHMSSENSIFIYNPNDMNHLLNSAGVCYPLDYSSTTPTLNEIKTRFWLNPNFDQHQILTKTLFHQNFFYFQFSVIFNR